MDLRICISLSFLVFSFCFCDDQETPALEPEESFKIEVIKEPKEDCVRKSQNNDFVSMHYTGYLKDSMKKFDSSRDRNQPFEFSLGTGYVIPGWEKGVVGMCVGEQRRLTIPPDMAYGSQGFGDLIPPMSVLVFDVELLAIKEDQSEEKKEAPADPDSFEAIDKDGNGALSWEEMELHVKERPKQEGDGEPETLVSEIFQEGDKDKDGTISYEEFYGRPKDEL